MIKQGTRFGVVALICGVTVGGLSACSGTPGASAPASTPASAASSPPVPSPAAPSVPPSATVDAGPVDLPMQTGDPGVELVPVTSGSGPYRTEKFAFDRAFRLTIACTGGGRVSWTYGKRNEKGQKTACTGEPLHAVVITDETRAAIVLDATSKQRWTLVVEQDFGVK